MAHRVLGVDLGAHSIKVAELQVALRSVRLAQLATIEVPQGSDLRLGRSLSALAELLTQTEGLHIDATDIVAVGMPGDRVFSRSFQIPFTDPKKIEQVVCSELAEDLPWEEDDVVFDQRALAGAGESMVLVAGSPAADVEALLSGLVVHGVEPKCVLPAPLAYGALVRRMAPTSTAVLLDLGHLRTTVALLKEGRVGGSRTLSRGGHQLTCAVRDTFQLTYADAEALKEREGTLVEREGTDAAKTPQQHLSDCLREEVASIAADLRQTIDLLAARSGWQPEEVFLCGGTSCLAGIDRYLTAALGLPTRQVTLRNDDELGEAGLTDEGQRLGALALSLALEQGRRHALNLRQGRFAFKRTRSVLRDKLVPFASSVAAIVLFFVLSMSVSLHTLGRENTQLRKELGQATRSVLGERVADPAIALRKLQEGLSVSTGGIPEKTAADVFRLLSSRMPPSGEVTLDVKRLDIRQGKTELSGTVESRSAVGLIVDALEEDDCIEETGTGKISQVSDGRKQFSLTVETTCF